MCCPDCVMLWRNICFGSSTQKTDTQPSVGSNKHSYKPNVYFRPCSELSNKCSKSGHCKTEKIHSHYVFIILIFFLLCILPLFAYQIVLVILNPPEDDQSVRLAYRFVSSFAMLNSALNPALYCLRIDELRKAVVNFVEITTKRLINSDLKTCNT